MKKPAQTKTGKVQNRLRRMERRNFQKNATRRTGVHPVAENPTATTGPGKPVQKVRKTRETGMIVLRVERMTKRLVRSMEDCPGASFETHADACGLGLTSFYTWMGKGEEEPTSCYGKFRAAMVKAMAAGEKVLHKAAMRTHAIHLLARRFPNHYPSERQLMEVSAKDGMPLFPSSEQQFSVVLELHQPGQATEEPEPAFRIVQPDGRVDLWTPQSNNGETPPS